MVTRLCGAWTPGRHTMATDARHSVELSLATCDRLDVGLYRAPHIVMAQYRNETDPARCREQPLSCTDGIVATFSGSLHNADDLRRTLGLHTVEPVDLVASGYKRWGVDSFAHLTGDWSAVILDARRELVMMARDFVGTCPLYYRLDLDALTWSSNLSALQSLGPTPQPRLDPAYLAGFLSGSVPRSRTPFIEVRAVPPGHAVICDKRLLTRDAGTGAVPRFISFWRPAAQPEWRQRTPEDYANQLHTLLRESVDCRLPSSGRTWIELSGGLDSSTIVAVGAGVTSRRPVDVTTVTYVFDQSVSADERSFSNAVRHRFGLASTELREGSYSLFFPSAPSLAPQEPIPGGGRVSALIQAMHETGASVLLSGSGGDSVMWNAREPRLDLTDLAYRLRTRALLDRIRRYREQELCSYKELLWNSILNPLARGYRRRPHAPESASWVNWRRVRSLTSPDLDTRATRVEDTQTHAASLPSERYYVAAVRHAIDMVVPGDMGPGCDVSFSYPFFDRRLIDFMLSMPFEEKRAPGTTRVLHRRALTGVLPECVRQRVAKVGATEPLYRAVRREWSRVRALFGEHCVLAREGLIHSPTLIAALDDVRAGLDVEPFALMRTISLEAWLQSSSARTLLKGGES
jgi:asparagine synthase (glutamine-hydrolysing)